MKKKVGVFVVVAVLMLSLCSFSACKKEETIAKGQFYTLQEAYDNGFINQDDLKNIAYYQNNSKKEHKNNEKCEGDNYKCEYQGFFPMPKTPEVLSNKTERAIRETYAQELQSQGDLKAKYSDINITAYRGTYNGGVAVKIGSGGWMALYDVTIEGVVFHYSNHNFIMIWKEDAK